MDDIDRNTNYFKLFNLSMQDSQKNNYENLKIRLKELNDRRDENGINLQQLANKAIPIFEDDTEYNEYLRYWKAKEQGTGNTERQKQLEEELRRTREAQQREQEKARTEEEKRRRLEAELEEKRKLEKEQSKPETLNQENITPKTGWQLFGEIAGSVAKHMIDRALEQRSTQNPSASSNSYSSQLAQPTANLSGVWQDSQGIVYTVEQRGNQIRVQGSSPFQIVGVGIGTVNGRIIQLRSQSLRGVTESYLELSPDGRQLNGSGVNYTTGERYVVWLWRQ
ncbi:MAG: hypothetical protein RMY36_023210 [Nostoc sp. SerVER01]|nr:hypothetical protein [Nostoc sp. SerVER01]